MVRYRIRLTFPDESVDGPPPDLICACLVSLPRGVETVNFSQSNSHPE